MQIQKPMRLLLSLVLLFAFAAGANLPSAAAGENVKVYLPLIFKPAVAPPPVCAPTSGNSYAAGGAIQWDRDNPVRPTAAHADKNLALRSYSSTNAPKVLVNLGSDDPNQPPQLATLFNPYRLPTFSNTYRAHHWDWAPSPTPGTPGGPITDWPATVLGLATTAGETLRVPVSDYTIGGGMEVLVIFADADTIALKYTREDSVAQGYLVHIDNICTDPNLLALYNSLDSGARYVYLGSPDHNVDYNLPNLPAGQVFGTARGGEVRVAVVDSGAFMDPRSCNEWWQIRPGHPGCP